VEDPAHVREIHNRLNDEVAARQCARLARPVLDTGWKVHMIKMTNVLVATDFSDASEPALVYGREFARTFGAALHVLHVVENPMLWTGPEAAGVDFARLQAELEASAQNTLNRIVTAEDRQQLKAIPVVRTGSAAIEIAGYAKAEGIDMILIGTHGRGIVRQLLMGSVAEKVVRIAPCPVLTVRPHEHDFIQPDALETFGAVKH
jgi:nucleotide-binding universal stress UspA family protein